VVRVQNTIVTGYSTIGYYDNTGSAGGFVGYGNASVVDTTVASRNYWRSRTSPFVVCYGTGAVSTAAMYIDATNGNTNIGSTAGDPGVKLRVQGALTTTGNSILGDATTDTHTLNGRATINAPASATGDALTVTGSTQANIVLVGDNAGSGSSAAYTGFVLKSGSTERWFIGRDGTGNTDGLIFRRAGTTDDLKIDTSGNTFVTGNLAVNTNKFNVTASSGNTLVAGTLGVTGLATLTAGFTLGATSSAGSNKITNLTNGSSAQDAAAFGQIATAVSAAVSGTTNTLAKFTAANVIGNSSVTDDGTTVTVDGIIRAEPTGVTATNPVIYLKSVDEEVEPIFAWKNCSSNTDDGYGAIDAFVDGTFDTTAGALMAYAFGGSITTSRSAGANNLTNIGIFGSASGAQINYSFYGAAGTLYNAGAAQFDGNVTLGNAAGDAHVINGTTDFNHAVNIDGAVTMTSTLGVNGAVDFDSTLNVDGNATFNGRVTATDDFLTTGELAPAQITSNQNNYSPTGLATATVVIINSDAARDITGFATGVAGRHIWLYNSGSFTITLRNVSGLSSAGNQIIGRSAADTSLTTNTGCHLYYASSGAFGGTSYWVVMD
jgi:hypothetical protein